MSEEKHDSIWIKELHDVLRGISGGAIVSMPLLYTMEVWWFGMTIDVWHLMGLILLVFVVNIGLNYMSGFKSHRGLRPAVADSVESLGIAAFVSAVLLFAAGVINRDSSFPEAFGKILLESVPVSIGVSIASTQFAGKSRTVDDESEDKLSQSRRENLEWRKAKVDMIDLGASAAGALVFVFNLVPTDEIVMIATRIEWYQSVLLIIISLFLSYSTIFVADFVGKERRRASEGLLQQPVPETIVTYVVSVSVAMLLLFFLRADEVFTSIPTMVSTVAAVGLPAAIGGAAARLVL